MNLAMDIGGSKIALALFEKGTKRVDQEIPLKKSESAKDTLDRVIEWTKACGITTGGLTRIAIASAPSIKKDGVISSWPNRPHWIGHDIISQLQPLASEALIWLDDGAACTVADVEYFPGQTLMHIVIGTGIGGNLWSGGSLLPDPEFGHEIVIPNGKLCVCSKSGCLQAYVSCNSFDQTVRSIDASTQMYMLPEAAQVLASFVQKKCVTFDLDRVLVSGGFTQKFPRFLSQLQNCFRQCSMGLRKYPTIELSPNRSNASLRGAQILAQKDSLLDVFRIYSCNLRWIS